MPYLILWNKAKLTAAVEESKGKIQGGIVSVERFVVN
jgi:hypothetical protein